MALLDDFYTKKQLAAELGCCTHTIDRWITRRVGPARTKIGKRIFFAKGDVVAWLEARREKQTEARRGRR